MSCAQRRRHRSYCFIWRLQSRSEKNFNRPAASAPYLLSVLLKIARARYNAGSGEFFDLLDAEREQLRSRDQLAQLQQQSFIRLVFTAFLGGIQLI